MLSGAGEPVKAHVKLDICPTITVKFSGCVVMTRGSVGERGGGWGEE